MTAPYGYIDDSQAGQILDIWQESGRTVLAGPAVDDQGAPHWYATVAGGPTFRGEDLTDALAQLTTWLAVRQSPAAP